MTDARVPEKWLVDRRVNTLSDGAFRAFVNSLTWSVSNRTDGRFLPADLGLIPRFAEGSHVELVDAGLWIQEGNAWVCVDFAATQTSRHDLEVLENARRADRESKQRRRAAEKVAEAQADLPLSTGHVPRTTQDRTGQAVVSFNTDLSNSSPKRSAQKRGTRIPHDFAVTPQMVEWARSRAPRVDGPKATEKFVNHFTAQTRNATKLDWAATWRNWMIREQEYLERGTQQKSTPEDRFATTQALPLADAFALKELR